MMFLSILLTTFLALGDPPVGGPFVVYTVTDTVRTVVPDGFEVCYVSHLGRHGSRNQLGRQTDAALRALRKEDRTAAGDTLLEAVRLLSLAQQGHASELTAVGAAQQRGIGRRMAAAFPELFSGGGTVRVRSSARKRCLQSREAFLEGLQASAPVSRTSHLGLTLLYSGAPAPGSGKKKAALQVPDSLLARISTARFCETYFRTPPKEAEALMNDVFIQLAMAQNLDQPDRLPAFFTAEEIRALEEVLNLRTYVLAFDSAEYGLLRSGGARRLAAQLVRDADRALAGSGVTADLRFGHDTGLAPLAARLGLVPVLPVRQASEGFAAWREICMASNLQLVFYRHAAGEVLVKVLYNEAERLLPGLSGGPYYRWEEVRALLLDID